MDDYILKILLEQQEMEPEHTGEAVREKLSNSMEWGEPLRNSGQRASTASEEDTADGSGRLRMAYGEHDTPTEGAGRINGDSSTENRKELQREETIQKVLEHIRQSEESWLGQKAQTLGAEVRVEEERPWQDALAAESGISFGKKGTETGQGTMEPERLSMYFQRDARRYS